jgi:acetyl-CoA carboxylase carboxyltransferase component
LPVASEDASGSATGNSQLATGNSEWDLWTSACFEPTIDYCVVKIPRWTFEKFPDADETLTTQMKSVGEAMSIGRTFKEALQKGIRSMEVKRFGFGLDRYDKWLNAEKEATKRRSDEATKGHAPYRAAADVFEVFSDKPGAQYDVKAIIASIVDSGAQRSDDGSESLGPDFDEYKAEYGQSIVCGYAMIDGNPCGIVANQKKLTTRQLPAGKAGPAKFTNMPGVIYDDSADKAARFILDCNQRKIPIVFLHDTTGFMVGRDSEQGGIIRAGAKLVNAVSNSVVPKIVVILGGSYGAGHYAMCGRAFEPFITLAWPSAKYAVMGANQSTGTLATIEERSRERKGETIDEATHKAILDAVRASYNEQQDIRYAAARGWVDRIIEPNRTREELIAALEATANWDWSRLLRTGVLQT